MVHSEPVYVGQDPRIPKIDKSSVDEKAGGVSGVEDVKVSVFDPTAIEIGRGISLSIKWGGILHFTLAPSAN